jgi:hypothetical protein
LSPKGDVARFISAAWTDCACPMLPLRSSDDLHLKSAGSVGPLHQARRDCRGQAGTLCFKTMNLLKFQTKHIQAKTDIAYGRLRLSGPRWSIIYDHGGGEVPLVHGTSGPENKRALVAKPGHTLQAHAYSKCKTSEGQCADVSQEVAYNLCIKENLAELISGGAFSVIEQKDGIHLVEQWMVNTKYGGAVHELFLAIERIEFLVPYPCYGAAAGDRVRIRAIDWLAGANPRNCVWEGEKADPPTPEGTGNPYHRFRILRASPVSKAVAIKQAEQSNMLKALWDKTFPGQPIFAETK